MWLEKKNGIRNHDLCDTGWAIKPTGSRSVCEFVIYPYTVKNTVGYTSQLKYVFRLEEDVSRAVGQNLLTPQSEQNSRTP